MSVFFIETATTEIYTYVHTLSLHGALPILSKQGDNYDGTGSAPVDASLFGGGLVPLPGFGIFGNGKYNWLLWALIAAGLQIGRAPSELQSLMRISYAVFCLKKKQIQYCTHNHH